MIIKKILKNITKPILRNDELIKVYSHPRSGTHFLEAFLAKNFYFGKQLSVDKVVWGHWSNRMISEKGNPYGMLFGNHYFPEKNKDKNSKIYIIRDGRAVAYSIWKTNNFVHKELEGISFKDFLRKKIDWSGSPAVRCMPKYNIIEHWFLHVNRWSQFAKKNNNTLIIRYEDLVNNPYEQYLKIHNKFFSSSNKISENELNPIKNPVGLLPNKAIKDSWKEIFTKKDLDTFHEIVPKDFIFINK